MQYVRWFSILACSARTEQGLRKAKSSPANSVSILRRLSGLWNGYLGEQLGLADFVKHLSDYLIVLNCR